MLFTNDAFAVLKFHIYRFAGHEHNKDRDEKTKYKLVPSQVSTKL